MGALLVLGGYGAIFIGAIMVAIAAFKESVLWGLGCLFVPIVGLVFLITHWEEAKSGFLLQLGGIGLIVLGGIFGGGSRNAAIRLPANTKVNPIVFKMNTIREL